MLRLRSMLAATFVLALVLSMAIPSRSAPASSLPAGAVNTGFLPSRHGLSFRNPVRDPSRPLIEQLTTEQCGGMAFAALDAYASEKPSPIRSARALSLQMRSAQSIAANGGTFVAWSMWPDHARSPLEKGVVTLTRTEELPKLREALNDGPVPIGLVRARRVADVGLNHQVVAYSLERRGSKVRIGIYDPTQPGADDVRLVIDLADESGVISERAGEWEIARWRGLFVESYVSAGKASGR